MNPIPTILLALIGGYFLGHHFGYLQALEELGEMPSWEEVQAEVAREGLQ